MAGIGIPGIGRVVGMLLGVLAAVSLALGPQAGDSGAATTCAGSLQAKIDAAPAGGTVLASPCIYREQVTIGKPLVLRGQPGSEIRGSDVWAGWNFGGGYWRSSKTLPTFPQTQLECEPGTSRCLWPEQAFLDGKSLWQVASNPKPGQFAVDGARRVVLGDDPTGRMVEVSVRRHWVLGTTAADDVTVEGFTMRHAANESRSGAIMNRPGLRELGGSGWTVQKNRLWDAHGAIISLKYATGLEILDNDIARGGQIGINGAGNGEVVRGNKIHHNNTEDFNIQGAGITEAGGAKFAPNVSNTTFSYNEVYSNNGNGVHYDIDAANNTISNNRVHHNSRKGIQYEISTGGTISNNVLWENGWATPQRMQGGAIVIMNSSSTEVYNNTLAWNADGIAVYSLDREGTKWDLVHDVYVHGNTILARDYANDPSNNLALGWLQGWSSTLFDPLNNNRGANNRYWYPSVEGTSVRYEWKRISHTRLTAFNLTPGEELGRYMGLTEKNAVVANKGIPANPEPR